MLKHFLKISFRHLIIYKTYFGLQFGSLAIGITCFLITILYIEYELSFDKHFTDYQSIYRIRTTTKSLSTDQKSAMVTPRLSSAFHTELDLDFTRIYHWPYGDMMVVGNEKSFYESNFFRVDSSFLNVFQLQLINGSLAHALTKPNSVLISQEISQKYFGSQSPVNKVLKVNELRDYLVTGVFKLPENSHFDLDFLAFDGRNFPGDWSEQKVWFYLKCPKDWVDHVSVQLDRIVTKYYPESIASTTNLTLQALEDIHLTSSLEDEFEQSGNQEKLFLFSIAGILTAILTCLNFVNLATSRFMNRAKEIGIKKIHGAGRSHLFFQFLLESVLISLFGCALGLCCLTSVDSFLPNYLQISNHSISTVIIYACALAIFIGIVSGIYPAVQLSHIRPLKSITQYSSRSSNYIRSILVGIQMTICIIFLFMISKINGQLDYVFNKSELIKTDQTLLLNVSSTLARSWGWNLEPLKNELLGLSSVEGVSGIAIPWKRGNLENRRIRFINGDRHEEFAIDLIWVSDQDYHKLYGLKLIEGTFEIEQFEVEIGGDGIQFQYVINQEAAELINDSQLLNQQIDLMIEPGDWRKGEVVGVVENFHYQSTRHEIKPLIFIAGGGFTEIAIRYSSTKPPLEAIKKIWSDHTDWPITYSYLFEDYKNLYQMEYESKILLQTLSFVVSALAMLGLFGLVSYEVANRRRDIAIRKVLGAPAIHLFESLNKKYAKLFLIALLTAIPITYFLFEEWASGFVYTIEFGLIDLIVIGILIALATCLVTMPLTFRAIVRNPVSELRNE